MPGHGTHLAAGADPFSVGDLRKRRIEAVDVVGGGAGVTAEQLSPILTHTAKLDVVIVFLLQPFIPPVIIILPFGIRQIVPCFPLDPLLLLEAESQTGGGVYVGWVGEQMDREGMQKEEKKKGGGGLKSEGRGWGVRIFMSEGRSGGTRRCRQ